MIRLDFWTLLVLAVPIWVYERRQWYVRNVRSFSLKREILVHVFFAYILFLASVTLFPLVFYTGHHEFDFNWTPFVEMKWLLYRPVVAWMNIAGNIVLFVPLTALLPALYKPFRGFWRLLVIGMLCSTGIELLQCWIGTRNADIDDIFLNSTGAALGYGVYRLGHAVKGIQYWGFPLR